MKRCNLANGAGTILSSSTRSPIMHDEQRERLVCIAEHEVALESLNVFCETGDNGQAA